MNNFYLSQVPNNKKQILSEMTLVLMPGVLPYASKLSDVYNKTYQHWRTMWTEILDIGQGLPSDAFTRQSILAPLLFGDHVAGLIACSYFDGSLAPARDQGYLKAFPQEIFETITSKVDQRFMSIEFLTVDPQFRKSQLGFSLGDVLLGVSMKVFETNFASVVLGTARSKIHVDEMCYKFGFIPCGQTDKFGHPCTLIVNDRNTLKSHPDPLIDQAVDELWARKIDSFQLIDEEPLKKIA